MIMMMVIIGEKTLWICYYIILLLKEDEQNFYTSSKINRVIIPELYHFGSKDPKFNSYGQKNVDDEDT